MGTSPRSDLMSSDALFVPKTAVVVSVADATGREHRAEIFVEDHETLQLVLQSRAFVPLRRQDEAGKDLGIEFLARRTILWVRLDLLTALDEFDLEAESSTEGRAAQVRLSFVGAAPVEGMIRYLRPAESRRLSDYLESLPPFFPVRTPDYVYLVARDHVLLVEPIVEVLR